MLLPIRTTARTTTPRALVLALMLALAACAGTQGNADAGLDATAGDGGGSADGTGSGGLVQGSGSGFSWSFRADAVALDCAGSRAQMAATGAPSVASGDTVIFAGYVQVGDNQDPVLVRFDGEQQAYCEHGERQPPDGRAYGLTWDGAGQLYALFTVVGGGTLFDSAASASGGWIPSYGSGGGAAVSFVGRVDPATGVVTGGTFVPARLSSGRTNTLKPSDAFVPVGDGTFEFHGDSAFTPLNADRTPMGSTCTDYPFTYRLRLSADLHAAACASSTHCAPTVPCP